MSNEVDDYYETVTKEITAEMSALADNLARGLCVTEAYPYQYWIGLYRGHAFVLDTMKRSRKKMRQQFLEDDEDDES